MHICTNNPHMNDIATEVCMQSFFVHMGTFLQHDSFNIKSAHTFALSAIAAVGISNLLLDKNDFSTNQSSELKTVTSPLLFSPWVGF